MRPLFVPRPERLELICFAALGIVVSLQWASLVSDPPAGRVVLAVVLATAAGAALDPAELGEVFLEGGSSSKA